jgi:methylated-DNA-[protein]-cysteine S-methyltransferase
MLVNTPMRYTHVDTPIGTLLVAGDDTGLRLISFPTEANKRRIEPNWRRDQRAFSDVRGQLCAYFAGNLTEFDLPLAPDGTTFQLSVWDALRMIPYGTTTSYGELARRIGRPKASRAVGAANGRNPLPIVIPCHRVIGSDGKLTGFGGGLPIKSALLNLERGVCAGNDPQLANRP